MLSTSCATDDIVLSVISSSGKDPLAAVLDSNNTLKKLHPQRSMAESHLSCTGAPEDRSVGQPGGVEDTEMRRVCSLVI